ncbi:MAG: flagellar biosynthesis anti-sigma factor FlgM [Oscillospiraceae bacterium]|jgi:flagellar biosynthesis anti-sigma factor FlgM|nr:flagellar biosynthesis anti-sigma factor FlgM [Oscillospiraceae bacterium]
MKIDPISNQNMLRSYRAGSAKSAMKSAAAPTRDEAVISEDALTFSKVMAQTRSEPVRTPSEETHIAEVKQAVREGKYRIDSYLIAEKILSGPGLK